MNHFQRIFHFKCFTKFFLLTSNQLAYIMSIIFSGISFKYLIKFLFWNNWAIELNHRVVFTLVIPTQWNKERKKKIGGKCRNTLKIYSHLYKISKMYIFHYIRCRCCGCLKFYQNCIKTEYKSEKKQFRTIIFVFKLRHFLQSVVPVNFIVKILLSLHDEFSFFFNRIVVFNLWMLIDSKFFWQTIASNTWLS